MLKKLWRRLTWRRTDEDRYDLFHPKDKAVYLYHDGNRVVVADPMELYDEVSRVWQDLSMEVTLARSIHSKASEGRKNAAVEIRRIFKIKPVTEGGLGDIRVFDLLDHFLTYTGFLKKNSRGSATLQGATSAGSEPSSAVSPPTQNSSECVSTEDAPKTGPPSPSTKECPSPSA